MNSVVKEEPITKLSPQNSGAVNMTESLPQSAGQSSGSDYASPPPKQAKKAKTKTCKKAGKKLVLNVKTGPKKQLKSKAIKKNNQNKPKFNKLLTFGDQARTEYHCDECNEDFTTGQALGGHMSRVHPGRSETYARKVERRKEREFDRELLRLAKIRHARELGRDAPLDRVKIRRYKKQLKF